MNRASRSTPAVNAGVNIARRCGRKSSTPPSGPSTVSGRSCPCARSPRRPAPPSPRSTGTSPTSRTCSRRSANGCATCSGRRSSRRSTWRRTPPARSSAAASSSTSRLVDQHPNVVRFLLQGRFADQSAAAMTTVNKGRDITLAIADMVSSELEEMELDRPRSNWRRSRSSAPRRRRPTGGWARTTTARAGCLPIEFVAHLTTIMVGAINGTGELLGIKIDADQPIHTAVRRQQPVA